MYYYKISYKLKDTKANEEFLIFIYCKSEHDKLNRSDLPRVIKDAVYSLPHIEELELNKIDSITAEEYQTEIAE